MTRMRQFPSLMVRASRSGGKCLKQNKLPNYLENMHHLSSVDRNVSWKMFKCSAVHQLFSFMSQGYSITRSSLEQLGWAFFIKGVYLCPPIRRKSQWPQRSTFGEAGDTTASLVWSLATQELLPLHFTASKLISIFFYALRLPRSECGRNAYAIC